MIRVVGDVKEKFNLRTHECDDSDMENKWCCWDDYDSVTDYISRYGSAWMGFGDTESEAINDFLDKNYDQQ